MKKVEDYVLPNGAKCNPHQGGRFVQLSSELAFRRVRSLKKLFIKLPHLSDNRTTIGGRHISGYYCAYVHLWWAELHAVRALGLLAKLKFKPIQPQSERCYFKVYATFR